MSKTLTKKNKPKAQRPPDFHRPSDAEKFYCCTCFREFKAYKHFHPDFCDKCYGYNRFFINIVDKQFKKIEEYKFRNDQLKLLTSLCILQRDKKIPDEEFSETLTNAFGKHFASQPLERMTQILEVMENNETLMEDDYINRAKEYVESKRSLKI